MSFKPHALVLALASTAAALAAVPVHAADYVQAAGSTLTFATRYQGEVFVGRLPGFATRLSFDPQALATGKLEVSIPLVGVSTANDDRDSTLKGGEFFNVAKYPVARYSASTFRRLGGNRYAADGTLSLHGINKPVTLTFTWTPGAVPVLRGQATLKRLDFGIGLGDWADVELIPNDVAVSTQVVFAPAK